MCLTDQDSNAIMLVANRNSREPMNIDQVKERSVMSTLDLVAARKRAEAAVADMADGALKEKAFEVILGSLLAAEPRQSKTAAVGRLDESHSSPPSSLPDRISLLADEGFFTDPKSLSDIQAKLAEHGWHYPQTNLSTPLVRFVRQRRLRRLQLADGNKRVWKYALP